MSPSPLVLYKGLRGASDQKVTMRLDNFFQLKKRTLQPRLFRSLTFPRVQGFGERSGYIAG